MSKPVETIIRNIELPSDNIEMFQAVDCEEKKIIISKPNSDRTG